MDLQYNLLSLPRKVSKETGTGSVEYIYLASGAKLAKKANGVFTQFYNGSVVYKGDKTAEYISTSEGLAMKTANGFAYQYNLSDHLGNVRVVLNQDKSVAQSTNYYPFGLAHATSALDKNKYLYNGKEIQNDLIGGTTFGMLDYGARFYDPVIGRWHSIDPLAENSPNITSFAYVHNNPINLTDPFGLDTVPVNKVDWNKFDTENDVVQLDEAVVEAIEMSTLSLDYDRGDGWIHNSLPNEFSQKIYRVILGDPFNQMITGMPPLPGKLGGFGKAGGLLKKSGKNEKHGDDGRSLIQAEKRIQELEKKLESAKGVQKTKIKNKIKNIREDAAKKKKGVEHSNANKR